MARYVGVSICAVFPQRGSQCSRSGLAANPNVSLENLARLRSHAEILTWQSRLRILVASTAAVAELLLLAGQSGFAANTAAPAVPIILLATVAYVLMAASTAAIARRSGAVPGWVLAATMCGDVAFIFGLTIAVSAPQYYDRILIFAFVALHLNTFYFGRKHAAAVLALTVLGYVALVHTSMIRGADLQWREEIWSLGAFLIAATLLLVEHGSLRNRLTNIVRLFGRAEEGDFSEAYDDESDARPDAVTRVGQAYNRVREQLASMVLTDPLTGCVNRRGFDQALAREVARATRAGSELALLALDVDHFKAVNDTLGHPAGDCVLREVGALLMHAARAGDVVARTGGEEFALVLPDTSSAGAYQLASRLCDALRAHHFASDARGVRLTVSIGIVATEPGLSGPTMEIADVLKGRADEALYIAKRGGRDRVRAWAPATERVPVGVLT